jgi:hypothetical protein
MIHVNPTFQYIEDFIFKHCTTMLHKLGGQSFHNENIIIIESMLSHIYVKKYFILKLNFEMAFSCSTYNAFTQV